MLDFPSIESAQRWLDENGGRYHRADTEDRNDIGGYACRYGLEAARCMHDCVEAANWGTFTQLKMAARRLSNALAYHHPATFEPKRKHAA